MSLWKILTARWGSATGEYDQVRIDASTNSLQTIDYAHHEIHGGSTYDYTEVFELTNGQVLDIQVTAPAGTKYAHLIYDYLTEKETEFWMWENVAINTPGTAVTPRNHRRPSADSTMLTIKYIINADLTDANADTVVAGATQLVHTITGEGGKKGSGGSAGSREEWILKPEDYSFRWEAKADGYVALHLDYYEHTDKH